MQKQPETLTGHTTSENFLPDFLPDWADQFYQAKKAEGVSPCTLAFYKQQLGHFLRFCDAQVITRIPQITPQTIRQFILWHEETGHNPGGLHAAFRVVKTFLRWYEAELEPEGWKNPIQKVKAPKLAEEPLEPVEVDSVLRMAGACDSSILGKRDRAMLLALLDTGARAREFTALNRADVDQVSGQVLIRQGKGGKPRPVFLGKKARQALRAYLKARKDKAPALWAGEDGERLNYGGLRKAVIRRAKAVGCPTPGLHDFRRAFALAMLRSGVDLMTLARLMGHTNLKTLQRYLRQLPEDLQAAHVKGSPVDKG